MEISTKFTSHLNGGDRFSEFHYVILVDNKMTTITQHTRTDGSPEYNITADELHFEKETFNLLKGEIDDAKKWIATRMNSDPLD